jgi:hypothetical protein
MKHQWILKKDYGDSNKQPTVKEQAKAPVNPDPTKEPGAGSKKSSKTPLPLPSRK